MAKKEQVLGQEPLDYGVFDPEAFGKIQNQLAFEGSLVGIDPSTLTRPSVLSRDELEEFEKYAPGLTFEEAGGYSGLEEARAQQQTRSEQWVRGVPKFVGKTATATLGGTVGAVVGLGAAIASGDFNKTYDNAFSNALDTADEWMDEKMGVYSTEKQRDENFYKSLNNSSFWANDVLGGLSFTAGAVLSELVWSAATVATAGLLAPIKAAQTTALMARTAKFLKNFSKADDVLKQLGKASTLNKVNDAGRVVRQMYTGAGYESGVEARHHKKELLDKLQAEYFANNPDATEIPEDAMAIMEDTADRSANGVFAMNLGIVGLSQAIALPRIFGPGVNSQMNAFSRITRTAEDIGGAWKVAFTPAYQNTTRLGKIANAAYLTAKNPFVEGIWEEGMQGVANNTMLDYTTKKYNEQGTEDAVNFAESFGNGLKETYGGKDGWKEIGIGMIIGGMGSPNFRALKRNSETKKLERVPGQPGWTGGIIGTFQEQTAQREKAESVANRANNATKDILYDYSEEYAKENPQALTASKEATKHIVRQAYLAEEMDKAVAEGDTHEAKNVEQDMIHSFIMSRIDSGYGSTLTDEFGAMVENMSDQEFSDALGYPEMTEEDIVTRKRETLTKFNKRVKDAQKITKLVDNTFRVNLDDQINRDIRESLIYAGSTINDVETRETEMTDQIAEDTGIFYEKEARGENYRENYRKSVMEAMKNRPKAEKAAMEQNLNDLDKLQNRRENYIRQYNHLFTKKGQQEMRDLLTQVEESQKKAAAEAVGTKYYAGTVLVTDRKTGVRYKKHDKSDGTSVINQIDEQGNIIPDTEEVVDYKSPDFVERFALDEAAKPDERVLTSDESKRLIDRLNSFKDPDELAKFINEQIKPLGLANYDLVKREAAKIWRKLTQEEMPLDDAVPVRYVDRYYVETATGTPVVITKDNDPSKNDVYYVHEIVKGKKAKSQKIIGLAEVQANYTYKSVWIASQERLSRIQNLQSMIEAKQAILDVKKGERKTASQRLEELRNKYLETVKTLEKQKRDRRFAQKTIDDTASLVDEIQAEIETLEENVDTAIQSQQPLIEELKYLRARLKEEETIEGINLLKQNEEAVIQEIADNDEAISAWQKVIEDLKGMLNKLFSIFEVSKVYETEGKAQLDAYRAELRAEMEKELGRKPPVQSVSILGQTAEGRFKERKVSFVSPEWLARKKKRLIDIRRKVAAKKGAMTRVMNQAKKGEGESWVARGKVFHALNQVALFEKSNDQLREKLKLIEEEKNALNEFYERKKKTAKPVENHPVVKRDSKDVEPIKAVFQDENEPPSISTENTEESTGLWENAKRRLRHVFTGLTGRHGKPTPKGFKFTEDANQRRYYRWTNNTDIRNGNYRIKVVKAFEEDRAQIEKQGYDFDQTYVALVIDKEGKYITEEGSTDVFDRTENVWTSFPLDAYTTSEYDKTFQPATKKQWLREYPALTEEEAKIQYEKDKETLLANHTALRGKIKDQLDNYPDRQVIFRLVDKSAGVSNEEISDDPNQEPDHIPLNDAFGHDDVSARVLVLNTVNVGGSTVVSAKRGHTFVKDNKTGNTYEARSRKMNPSEVDVIIGMFRSFVKRSEFDPVSGKITSVNASFLKTANETVVADNMFEYLSKFAFWTGDNFKNEEETEEVNEKNSTRFHFTRVVNGKIIAGGALQLGPNAHKIFMEVDGELHINLDLVDEDGNGALRDFLENRYINISSNTLTENKAFEEITSVTEDGIAETTPHDTYQDFLINNGILGVSVVPYNVEKTFYDEGGNEVTEQIPQKLNQYAIYELTDDFTPEQTDIVKQDAPSENYNNWKNLKPGDVVRVDKLKNVTNETIKTAELEVNEEGNFAYLSGEITEDMIANMNRMKSNENPLGQLVILNGALEEQNVHIGIADVIKTEVEPEVEEAVAEPVNVYAGTNENAALSNFAKRPFQNYQDDFFDTVEGAFQAEKLMRSNHMTEEGLDADGLAIYKKLQTATGPQAKKIGKNIKGLHVAVWDLAAPKIMEDYILASFLNNPETIKTLLDTGNATITHTQDKSKWGELFPELLMKARDSLRGKEVLKEKDIVKKGKDGRRRAGKKGSNMKPYRIPKGDSRGKENVAEAKAWFKENFPNVDFEVVQHMIDGKAHGQLRDAAVYLYQNAEIGTTYHEAFHVVTHMFLNRRRRRALYREYRQRFPENKSFTNEQIEEELAEDFRDYMLFKKETSSVNHRGIEKTQEQKDAEDKQFRANLKEYSAATTSAARKAELEGILAAAYYAEGEMISYEAKKFKTKLKKYDSKLNPVKMSYFQQLYDWIINRIIGRPETIMEIFKNVEANEYANQTPRLNFAKGKTLNRTYKGRTEAFGRDAVEGVNYFFFQKLFDPESKHGINTLFSKENNSELVNELYAYAYDQIERRIGDLQEEQDQPETTEEQYDVLENTVNQLWFVLDNWTQAEDYADPADKTKYSTVGLHKNFLSQYKLEFVNIEENITETSLVRDPDNQIGNESIKVSAKLNASRNIKLMLGVLADVHSDFSPILNDLKLARNVEFDKVFSTLANKLAGLRTDRQMVTAINSLIDKAPYLKKLLDRLGFNTESETLSKGQMLEQVQFVQTFAKTQNIYMFDITAENGKFKLINSNRTTLDEKIKQNWSTQAGNKSPVLYDYKEDIPYYKPEPFRKLGVIDTPAKALKMFEMMGITFTTPSEVSQYDILREKADAIRTQIISKSGQVSVFNKEVNTNTKGDLDTVIALERDTTLDYIENSHLNIENNLVYDVVLNSYLSMIVNDINNFKTRDAFLEENPHLNPDNNPYAVNSLLMKLGGPLYKKNGDFKEGSLFLEIHEGSKEEESDIPAEFQDLGEPDQLRVHINRGFLGSYPLLRPADNSIERYLNLGAPLFSDPEIGRNAHVHQMLNYLRDELNRGSKILNDVKTAKELWKNQEDNAKKGIVIAILSQNPVIGDAIENFFTTEQTIDDLFEDEVLVDLMKDQISIYFNDRLGSNETGFIKLMIDYGLIEARDDGNYNNNGLNLSGNPSVINAEVLKSAIKNYLINDTISNIEQTKVIVGDPINFKTVEDQFKRHSGLVGTKKISVVYEQVNRWIDQNLLRADREIGGYYKNGQPALKTVVFADVKVDSKYHLEYAKRIGDKAAPYLRMDEGDGQGYITLDEWREMLYRAGEWTFGTGSLEDLYQYERQKDEGVENPKYADNDTFDNGRVIDVNKLPVANPLKPQHMGPLAEEGFNMALYKLSVFPMLPSVTKPREGYDGMPQLEALRQKMKTTGTGIAVFETANKVGTKLNENKAVQPFYDTATGEFAYADTDFVTQDTYYKYWGIQQEMGSKVKRKVVTGTQMMKQILNGIFENGEVKEGIDPELGRIAEDYIALNAERINIGMDQLIDSLGLVEEGGDYFVDSIENLIERFKKEAIERDMPDNIVDAIDTLKDTGGIDTLVNREKIENILMAIAGSMSTSQKRSGSAKVQVSNAIGRVVRTLVDTTTGQVWDSSDLAFYEDVDGNVIQMEVYLPSYLKGFSEETDLNELDSKLRDLIGFRIPTQGLNSIESIKIKGFLPAAAGDSIIVPSEIVAKTGSDFDVDKLNIYYPNVFYNSDNKPIYIEDLNPEQLNTQYKNYSDAYKARFLNRIVGDVTKAALPKDLSKLIQTEVTRILGNENVGIDEVLDHINDRISFIENVLTTGNEAQVIKYGELAPTYNAIRTNLLNLKAEVEEGKAPQFEPMTKQEFKKRAIENKISTLQKQIITHPDNFNQLITPVSAKDLEDEADEVLLLRGEAKKDKDGKIVKPKATMNQIAEREYLMDVARRFIGGKQAVGITAIHSTFDILAKMVGLSVKPSIKVFRNKEPKTIETKINLPHNKNENGDINLGQLLDKSEKGNIPERLSQWINAAVDAATNPFMFDLNSGPDTLNVVLYLTMAGVPLNYLTRFMSQPIIVDYIKNRQKWESQMMEGNIERVETFSPYTGLRVIFKSKKKFREAIISLTKQDYVDVAGEQNEAEYTDLKLDDLNKNIKQGAAETMTKRFAEQQIQSLDDFLRYMDTARKLGDAMGSVSYDTKEGGKNTSELTYRLENTDRVKEEGNFVNFSDILNKGFISPYYKAVKSLRQVLNPFFITLNNEHVLKQFEKLYEVLFDEKNNIGTDKKIKVVDKFKQSFITYLFVTRPYELSGNILMRDGSYSPMDTQLDRLFKGEDSIAHRVKDLQEKYAAEGRTNFLLEHLEPIINESKAADATHHVITRTKKIDNIKSNSLTNAWKELFDSEEAGGIGHDLLLASMLQYGILNTPFTFTNLIPFEIYGDIMNSILKKENLTDDVERDQMYDDFYNRFFINNFDDNTIVPKKREGSVLHKAYPFYKEWSLKPEYNKLSKKELSKLREQNVNIYNPKPDLFRTSDNAPIILTDVVKDYRNKRLLLNYDFNVPTIANVKTTDPNAPLDAQSNEFYQVSASLYNIASRWGMQDTGFFPKQVDEALLKQELRKRGFTDITVARASSGNLFLRKNGKKITPNNQKQEFAQLTPATNEAPDAAINQKIQDWLTQMGIRYENVEEITDRQGNPISAVAKADMLHAVVQVVEGKADITTLPEEAAHFLVELLGDDNPILKGMMNAIEGTEILEEVKAEYGELYGEDELKLKKEAVGKMIASTIVRKEKRAGMNRFQRWWESAMRWLKRHVLRVSSTMIEKDFAPYTAAADIILGSVTEGLEPVESLKPDIFYQVTEEEKATRDAIEQSLDETDALKDVAKGGYVTKAGVRVANRVSHFVDKFYKGIFGVRVKEKEAEEHSILLRQKGTIIHKYLEIIGEAIFEGKPISKESVQARVVKELKDKNDVANEEFFDKEKPFFALTGPQFAELRTAMTKIKEDIMLRQKQIDPKGEVKFYRELIIYDKYGDIGGMIDLAVLYSNGSVGIYDYKGINFNETKILPLYKEDAYNIQISEYKRILSDRYGIKNFGETRIIPIDIQMTKTGDGFSEVVMGATGLDAGESREYLEHIPVARELTTDPKLNKSLKEMFVLYDRLRKKLQNDHLNEELSLRVRRLRKSISAIQREDDVSFVADEISALFTDFTSRENLPADHEFGLNDLYLDEIQSYLVTYKNFSINALGAAERSGEENLVNKIKRLAHGLENLQDRVSAKFLENAQRGVAFAVDGSGKTPGFAGRLFNRLSQFSRPVFKKLSLMVNEVANKVRNDINQTVMQIKHFHDELELWSKAHGESMSKTFNRIINEKTGDLTSKWSKNYVENLATARADKKKKWFLENTEVEEKDGQLFYTGKQLEIYDRMKKKQYDFIDRTMPGDENMKNRNRERRDWVNKYDITNNPNALYFKFNKFVKPQEKAENYSEDYIFMTQPQNKALKDYYDMYVKFNEQFAQMTGKPISYNFVAEIRQDLIDRVGNVGLNNVGALLDSLTESFEMYQQDMERGAIDPVTGKQVAEIPLFYTSALKGGVSPAKKKEIKRKVKEQFPDEESLEYKNELADRLLQAKFEAGAATKSRDLSRSLVLFAHASYTHKHMSDTEASARALLTIMKSQGQETELKQKDNFTRKAAVMLGVPLTEIDTLEKFINLYWYRQSTQGGDITFEVGGKTISATKMYQSILRFTSAGALAMKPILALGNLAGISSNYYMSGREGLHYTQVDINKAHRMLLDPKDREMFAGAIQYFEPYTHDITFRKANNASVSKAVRLFTFENLFVMHRVGDEIIDRNITMAMMNRWGINKDGRITRLEKLTDEDTDKRSILERSKTENDHFTVDGLNEEQFIRFRRMIQTAATEVKGNISQEDKNLIGTTLAGQALMQFRNWMPGLISKRFKDLTYDDLFDSPDVGRFRVFFGEITAKRTVPLIGAFAQMLGEVSMIYGYGKSGINKRATEKFYNKWILENPDSPMTMEEFAALRLAKLQGMGRELQIYLAFALLVFGAKAAIPDEDEDAITKSTRLLAQNSYRVAQRGLLELSFFFDIQSVMTILKSPVPSLRLFLNLKKMMANTWDESWDVIIGEDSNLDKTPRAYYFSKITPVLGSYVDFVDLFETYNIARGY